MKKLIALLISGVIMLPCVNAFANDVIEVYIDGEKLECDVNPKNIDERVLVPMRAIFEAFGANVSWDNNGRTVWAERNGEFICVPVDNQIMSTGVYNSDGSAIWVDQIQLDVPAKIIDDRTYVPVRAVSETLGATVGWDGENNRVVIDSRINESGTVYYASDSDYQKLYSVDKNSADRNYLITASVNLRCMTIMFTICLKMTDTFAEQMTYRVKRNLSIKRSIKLPLMMGGYIIRNRTAEKRAAFFIV